MDTFSYLKNVFINWNGNMSPFSIQSFQSTICNIHFFMFWTVNIVCLTSYQSLAHICFQVMVPDDPGDLPLPLPGDHILGLEDDGKW